MDMTMMIGVVTRKRTLVKSCILPSNPVKRRRKPNHTFFEEGNQWCNVQNKQIMVDNESPVNTAPEQIKESDKSVVAFPCQVPQCQKVFTSVSQYESHYNSAHRYVCNHCHRTLPTSYLLDIHVLEWHDTMFELLVKKKPMFDCLVPECMDKFWSSQERKEHLIQTHKYPANFRFDKPAAKTTKKKKEKQKLKGNEVKQPETRDESSTHKTSPDKRVDLLDRDIKDVTGCKHTHNCDNNNTADSLNGKCVNRIPRNICFGQGSQKAFSSVSAGKKKSKKHWHQQGDGLTMDTIVNIEEVDMVDLATALDT